MRQRQRSVERLRSVSAVTSASVVTRSALERIAPFAACSVAIVTSEWLYPSAAPSIRFHTSPRVLNEASRLRMIARVCSPLGNV
jgi:hypothetical protein